MEVQVQPETLLQKTKTLLGEVAHAFSLSTREAEAGASLGILGQGRATVSNKWEVFQESPYM